MIGMRVAHVMTRFNIGGPSRVLAALVPRLAEEGIDQRIMYGAQALDEGFIPPVGATAVPLESLSRSIRPYRDAQAFWELRRQFRAFRPHIVHTRMAKAGALARLAGRTAGVPTLIHTFHGHVLDEYFRRPTERAILAAERKLASQSDVLVAVSEQVRDELLSLGVGKPDKWRVIPDGYELAALARSILSQTEARRRLGLPERGPLIGIVGRLVPVKDHQSFLEAAGEIAATHRSARFVIAGDGPLRSILERKGRGILGDRAEFLGWVHDLESLYRALDLVVLISRKEGTPAALIEANAMGVPGVATRVGGVADVVRDGQTGFLVPPGNPTAIAAAVGDLLDHRKMRDRMGQAARAHVLDRFDADRAASTHMALYREARTRARRERGAHR
jgi:glycosyltransferase involved in cell wall biosynthesis